MRHIILSSYFRQIELPLPGRWKLVNVQKLALSESHLEQATPANRTHHWDSNSRIKVSESHLEQATTTNRTHH
jgi:hypothetical protein